MIKEAVFKALPFKVQNQLDALAEAFNVLAEIKNPAVLRSIGPAGVKGLLLHRGKQGKPTLAKANHSAYFDWTYPSDQPAMRDLYKRAKAGQWNSDTDLAWNTSVDPLNPEVPLIPLGFFDPEPLRERGIHLDVNEQRKLNYSITSWMLSQFLHGEQGALFAAAQVTEAVQFFDGKLYGATQVMDEGRHVEVFSRYLSEKMNRLYQINDNLFVIIDALMTDGRWDMKFLGMQIMVEGLALGAFGTLRSATQEPLLRDLLKYVITDEARHVTFGVLALREHYTTQVEEKERRDREDWAFEMSLLMRNRFLAHEFYDEYYGHVMSRAAWDRTILESEYMDRFRRTMFRRIVPNLKRIGLLTPRIRPHYEAIGLLEWENDPAAPELSKDALLAA
mgnify:CR=1 FL=1